LVEKEWFFMCDMSKGVLCLLTGLVIGVMIGYTNEEEIDDLARSTRRAKRKMMRKMYDVKDHFDM